MKLKLDENLGRRGKELLAAAGHEVCTVEEQGLCGGTDRALIERCRAEGRCLVTFDLDFANPLVFQPSRYTGIAVLRLSGRASLADVFDLIRTFAGALARESIEGKLWIVEPGRIRVYQGSPTD